MPNDILHIVVQKLDKLDDRLDKVDITLAAQHQSLKDHMRRTDLLEKQVEPIKKHVSMVHGGLKLISVIGIVIAIAEGVFQVIDLIK